MHAGTGADIHHIVGQADCVLVVLDDDHRVADVPQMLEGTEQAIVVTLVQSDGRLVENVHHSDQPGADLAGQTDALGFAAGQGIGAAIQGQIVEAYVDQELQAFADLLEDLVGDLATAPGQFQPREIVGGIANRQVGDRRQSLLTHPHMSRFTT